MLRIILTMMVIAMLAACQQVADPLSGALPAAPDRPAGSQTTADQVADKLLPVRHENRPVRLCYLVIWAAQPIVEQTVRVSPGVRAAVIGRLMIARAAVQQVRKADPFWFESALARAKLDLAEVAFEGLGDRLTRLAARGVSLASAIIIVRSAGIVAEMAEAGFVDIKRGLVALEAGEVSTKEAWAQCEARFDLLFGQLSTFAPGQ